MKLTRPKILLILISVIIIFFAFTFYQKWGVTIAEKKTTDYKSIVKKLKKDGHFLHAKNECPSIISKLKEGIPELQKNNLKIKVLLNYKLIADCQYAMQDYKKSASNYEKLIVADPQESRWYEAFALALYGDENYGEALRFSHLAVQLSPRRYKNLILEARVLSKLNLPMRAIETYQEAISVAPYKKVRMVKKELNALLEANHIGKVGM